MECLLQYWDELDDLYWVIAALRERLRRLVLAVALLLCLVTVAGAAALATVHAPSQAPIAAATLTLCLLGRPLTGVLKAICAPD